MTFKEFAGKNQIIWLSAKQVARLMQCSVEHIYDLVKSVKYATLRTARTSGSGQRIYKQKNRPKRFLKKSKAR